MHKLQKGAKRIAKAIWNKSAVIQEIIFCYCKTIIAIALCYAITYNLFTNPTQLSVDKLMECFLKLFA